jgi:hypothetical protein
VWEIRVGDLGGHAGLLGADPAEQSPPVEIPPVSTPLLETQLALTSDGFYLQKFRIAPVPIAGFSCEPIPLQVTAHYTQSDATQTPEARPVLARGIALEPFQCRAQDGRTYTLTGAGQADLRAIFFNMTFSAWLGPGQATLMCTTRFSLQQSPDAGALDGVAPEGVPPNQVDTQTPDPEQSGEPLPPEGEGAAPGAEIPPDAGPDTAGAG